MLFAEDEMSNQEYEEDSHAGNTYDVYRRLDSLVKKITQYDTLNSCFWSMKRVTREVNDNKIPTFAEENINIYRMHTSITRKNEISWKSFIIIWSFNKYVESLRWAQLLLVN